MQTKDSESEILSNSEESDNNSSTSSHDETLITNINDLETLLYFSHIQTTHFSSNGNGTLLSDMKPQGDIKSLFLNHFSFTGIIKLKRIPIIQLNGTYGRVSSFFFEASLKKSKRTEIEELLINCYKKDLFFDALNSWVSDLRKKEYEDILTKSKKKELLKKTEISPKSVQSITGATLPQLMEYASLLHEAISKQLERRYEIKKINPDVNISSTKKKDGISFSQLENLDSD